MVCIDRFKLSFALLATIFVTNMNGQQMSRRIMNGIERDIKYFPWVVALTTENYLVVGTGTILSEKWVLTAGHLWDEPKSDKYLTNTNENTFVQYGATVIDQDHGEIVKIDDVFVHPYYLDPTFNYRAQYDSSMVRLVEPLLLKPGFAVAKPLADDSENYNAGEVCVMAGFGDTGDPKKNKQPHHLSFLPIPIIKRDVCKRHLRPFPRNILCAGVLSVEASGCSGDSGAPLTCRGRVYAMHTRGPHCRLNVPNAGIFVLIKTISAFIREVQEYE